MCAYCVSDSVIVLVCTCTLAWDKIIINTLGVHIVAPCSFYIIMMFSYPSFSLPIIPSMVIFGQVIALPTDI